MSGIEPLPRGVPRQRIARPGRLWRERVDAEAVGGQCADADRGVGQRREGIQRAPALRGDVAGRGCGVVLVEVDAVAAAQHLAPSPDRS